MTVRPDAAALARPRTSSAGPETAEARAGGRPAGPAARWVLPDGRPAEPETAEARAAGRPADPRARCVVAVVLLGVLGALAGLPARATYGAHTTADEPYYLLTALGLADDGSLDIADDLAAEAYRPFHEIRINPQTTPLDEAGRRLSPHDPLLPALLAPAFAVAGPDAGWVVAKALLALLAGLTAGGVVLLAVHGFGVRPRTAAVVAGGLALAVPLAPYGTQVYPELPAALLVLLGVGTAAALPAPPHRRIRRSRGGADPMSPHDRRIWRARGGANPAGPHDRRIWRARGGANPAGPHDRRIWRPWGVGGLAGAAPAVAVAVGTALPWLSVKYVPVAGVVVGLLLWRLWAAGRRRAVVVAVGVLAVSGIAYLVAHQLLYGGWTVYAAGDHFVDTGELSVVGVDPDHLGRTRRLVGLLVDRGFGIGTWAPAWLLVPAAVAALAAERHPHRWLVLAPAAAGWATATWVALTMHGWWVPGRQVVVVLPLLAVAVAVLVDRIPRLVVPVAGALLAGASSWAWLAVEASTGRRALVVDLDDTAAPAYRVLAAITPDGIRGSLADDLGLLLWTVLLTASALVAWRTVRSRTPSRVAEDGRSHPHAGEIHRPPQPGDGRSHPHAGEIHRSQEVHP